MNKGIIIAVIIGAALGIAYCGYSDAQSGN
jgi:hypothetical protein